MMKMTHVLVGHTYDKASIESLFHTRFGRSMKGINLRIDKTGSPYIILFSKEQGPYDDTIQDAILRYDGEGYQKDQTLTPANKALKESAETGRTIHVFRKKFQDSLWTYLGIASVLGHVYRKKHGYMTYEFILTLHAYKE
jgi:putative restriction endonuclease